MEEAIMDERGRVTIGRKLAKRYGRVFTVVPAPNEIILVPKSSKDPIKALKEWGKNAGLDKYTIRELRKMAIAEAEKEVMSD